MYVRKGVLSPKLWSLSVTILVYVDLEKHQVSNQKSEMRLHSSNSSQYNMAVLDPYTSSPQSTRSQPYAYTCTSSEIWRRRTHKL